jgi:U4/U6 small nuclear ribonucleoprotein PRP3
MASMVMKYVITNLVEVLLTKPDFRHSMARVANHFSDQHQQTSTHSLIFSDSSHASAMSSTAPSKRPAPIDIAQLRAEAQRRAEEAKARIEAVRNAASNGTSTTQPATNGSSKPKSAAEIAREKVEAIKARVAAATAKAKGGDVPVRPPPPPASAPIHNAFREPPTDDRGLGPSGRGGLAIGIHPALLGETKHDKKKSWNKAGDRTRKEPEKVNPYLAEAGTSGRAKRELKFTHNMHARPAMQAANEMRRKLALESMKKRIQQQAAKAGLDESTEIQAFAVAMPPEVEFWDEALQSGFENSEAITKLVVHPILIEPPQEKFVTLKPASLMLTKKEQKKMRKIRRAEEHREEQAKIRLGLVPTPAPKIKHSNVMRVYGEMAVKDPTAVEAMVNKQVAERKDTHIQANAERQLSKEERLEKIAQKAKENAAMGLNMCVFKIALGKDKLLGKHRYKIDMNAKQMLDVTGVVIVAPSVCVCIIEGGEHSTRKYKHLMLDRIQWQAILQGDNAPQDENEDNNDTTCTLLWQGLVRDRKFKKWGSLREVETDAQAKEVLTKAKMENFWTLAKSTE